MGTYVNPSLSLQQYHVDMMRLQKQTCRPVVSMAICYIVQKVKMLHGSQARAKKIRKHSVCADTRTA